MANDLASGVLWLFALSVLTFIAGRLVRAPRVSQWFFTALLASLSFAWIFSGDLGWAAIVPAASVIFVSNLMPMLLSFAAGLASEATALTRFSRPIAITSFLALATAYGLTPYARPIVYPVELGVETAWRSDVCLQSHSSTCAPAAAVTLLRLGGMTATERQLVNLCLTSSHGTEPLGLYRGLAIAVEHSSRRACVARSNPHDWAGSEQLPNISLVRLGESGHSGASHWLLGPQSEGHAIVVFDRDKDGNWLIADPAFGKTKWTDEQFCERFTGDAIYLSQSADP
jgi:hypothetical protein